MAGPAVLWSKRVGGGSVCVTTWVGNRISVIIRLKTRVHKVYELRPDGSESVYAAAAAALPVSGRADYGPALEEAKAVACTVFVMRS